MLLEQRGASFKHKWPANEADRYISYSVHNLAVYSFYEEYLLLPNKFINISRLE